MPRPVQNILVTVDAVVFYKNGPDLQVLLVKRKHEPFTGMWALPGGFVEDDEELEVAALRELEEETGLKLVAMAQLHTFGKVGRDSRGRTVSVVYYAVVDTKVSVAGADDAEEAAWLNITDIKALAFDHKQILEFAMEVIG